MNSFAERTRSSSPVIGVELSTYQTRVAVVVGNEPIVLQVEMGELGLINYVTIINPEKSCYAFGEKAKKYPDKSRTVYLPTFLLGCRYDDPDFQELLPSLKVHTVNENGLIKYRFDGVTYTYSPERILSLILERLKSIAASYLCHEVRRAVIAVPASFDQNQRQATLAAAELAGLEVKNIISAPCAVTVAFDRSPYFSLFDHSENILVFDFGKYSLNVAVVEASRRTMRILANLENNTFGGQAFQEVLVQHVQSELRKKGIEVKNKTLFEKCQSMKRNLGYKNTSFFRTYSSTGKEIQVEVTREKFERLAKRLFTRAMDAIQKVLRNVNGKWGVNKVLMVGGTSKIPKVQRLLEDYFGEQYVVKNAVRMEGAVATGAAIMGVLQNQIVEGGYSLLYEDHLPDLIRHDNSGSAKPKETRAEVDQCTQQQDQEDELSPVIGVDLGTSNSSVGVIENGRVQIVSVDEDAKVTLPSYIAFDDPEEGSDQFELLYGTMATEHRDPKRIACCSKRLLGRDFQDPAVHDVIGACPYKLVNAQGRPKYRMKHENIQATYFPEEISAYILKKLKTVAEDHLDRKVTRAVITVPANFNQNQRRATRTAAKLAGLEVMNFLSEPCAGAIAYASENKFNLVVKGKEQVVLVFDFGGGTLDVAILSLTKEIFKVLGIGGDPHLGGVDIDNVLADDLRKTFNKTHSMKLTKQNRREWRRLVKESEKAKIELTKNFFRKLDFLFEGKDLDRAITRKKFEELVTPLLEKAMGLVRNVLESCRFKKEYIDKVLLVGGSSMIPKMQTLLEDYFGRHKIIKDEFMMAEAVVRGATVMAALRRRIENPERPTIEPTEGFLRILGDNGICTSKNENEREEEPTVLVFDFSRKSLDLTLLSLGHERLKILAYEENTDLGGDHIDQTLAAYFRKTYLDNKAYSPRHRAMLWTRLVNLSKKTKEALTENRTSQFELDSVMNNDDLEVHVSRNVFEDVTKGFFDNVKSAIDCLLIRSNVVKEKVNKVLLVGGNCKILIVRKILRNEFGAAALCDIQEDEKVDVRSTTSQAGNHWKSLKSVYPDVPMIDVLPLSLGYKASDGRMVRVLERNTPVPAEATKLFAKRTRDQDVIIIAMYEGEEPQAHKNFFLGEFRIGGIMSAQGGMAPVRVTFKVDVDGALTASTGPYSRMSQQLNHTGMTPDEIQRALENMDIDNNVD